MRLKPQPPGVFDLRGLVAKILSQCLFFDDDIFAADYFPMVLVIVQLVL
jgi:hypothetical protein